MFRAAFFSVQFDDELIFEEFQKQIFSDGSFKGKSNFDTKSQYYSTKNIKVIFEQLLKSTNTADGVIFKSYASQKLEPGKNRQFVNTDQDSYLGMCLVMAIFKQLPAEAYGPSIDQLPLVNLFSKFQRHKFITCRVLHLDVLNIPLDISKFDNNV